MTHEMIRLFDERPWVTLEFFGNELTGGPRDAMLIIPGGGYHTVCSDREGYPIALAYLLQNRCCFILNYSVGQQIEYPYQLLEEASRAMLYIRENAGHFNINKDRVFAVGFSAGGHLAGWLGTCWNDPEIFDKLKMEKGINRPKGVVLCYPVVGLHSERERWFENLFRTSPITNEQKDKVSLQLHVNRETSPAFILHTYDDEMVPVWHSLELARAYNEAGVPFELHIYPHAPHGVALGTETTAINKPGYVNSQIARWVNDSCIWMESVK